MSSPPPFLPAADDALAAAYALVDVPLAWTDLQGRLLGANAAFTQATGLAPAAAIGRPLADLLGWSAGAAALASGQDIAATSLAGRDAQGRAWSGTASVRSDGQRQVLTLHRRQDDSHTRPAATGTELPAARINALLQTAQRLGRLGVWERDLRTGEGFWDPVLWGFFNRTPQARSPDLAGLMQALHPDDRAGLRQAFERSAGLPGHYSCRYRVWRADGQLRHVRSSWEVVADEQGRPVRLQGIAVDETETFQLARSFDDTQAQLQLAVAVAGIVVWQHDGLTRRLHLNDQGWTMLGLAPSAAGLSAAELAAQVHPEDLHQLRRLLTTEAVRCQRAGQHPVAPVRAVDLVIRYRRSGDSGRRWRHALTRRVPRHDSGGRLTGHVGVALDLSERLDQQQRALELARRLEMATSAAGVGVWSRPMNDPALLHWNAQMRALHELGDARPPEFADYLAHHVHPDDRVAVADNMATLLRRREGLLDMDLRIVLPGGRVRRLATRTSVESDAAGHHLYGVMFDVTERHATESQLRQAAERAALAARGAGIGTWESDPDGEIGHWDEQMFRLRGLQSRSGPVHFDEVFRWVHPDDRELTRRAQRAALTAGGPSNTEFRVVWPDGSVHWLASRATPVCDETGRVVRRIGINWDVTEVRHAAVARQERLMAQRESLAKSRFLARMSHELRTPLNAVLGFTQLLLADGPLADPATWQRRVQQVQASGEHLLALIDDVLELSSVESGELPLRLQPVALAPLVETTLPLLELASKAQQVTVAPAPMDGLWVNADPVRLRQVLLNLLSNAIKYNRIGGHVRLTASLVDAQWAKLVIEDTGHGMSATQVEHLFEPFNRLGREREGIAGTGIGLAIVRAAVQQMGGSVQVSSVPGVGSSFELTLQRARPPAAAAGLAKGAALPPPGRAGGNTLLYIEDNEVNLLIVSELVQRRADLRFVSAGDGHSGLAAARTHQPALILLDMQLPDIDGHEVLRQLRTDPATADIRVIALSANAMPEDIRRALDAGCADYWTKPLDLRAFMASLDSLFGAAPT